MVPRTAHRRYPVALKVEVARRYEAGETAVGLALEFAIAAPSLVQRWAYQLREGGQDALAPQRKQPRRKPAEQRELDPDAVEREALVEEVLQLRAEVAYLKKLAALSKQQRR